MAEMFLRASTRTKDGKVYRYHSVVKNQRVAGGRVVQRHVLYLGEIKSSQERARRRSFEVIEDGAQVPRAVALVAEDRIDALISDASILTLRVSAMRLRRPRQWGACWLALRLWQRLELDAFFAQRLPAPRAGHAP